MLNSLLPQLNVFVPVPVRLDATDEFACAVIAILLASTVTV